MLAKFASGVVRVGLEWHEPDGLDIQDAALASKIVYEQVVEHEEIAKEHGIPIGDGLLMFSDWMNLLLDREGKTE